MNDPRPWITKLSSRKMHRGGAIPRRVPAKVRFQACPTQAPAPSPPRGMLEHPNPTAGSGNASGGPPEADPNGPPPGTPEPDARAKDQGSLPPGRSELPRPYYPQSEKGSGQRPQLPRQYRSLANHRCGRWRRPWTPINHGYSKTPPCSLKGINLNLSEQSVCNSPPN